MQLLRLLSAFALLLLSARAADLSNNGPSIGKRSLVLEKRQGCSTPGYIPACPGPFSCIPPGGICCSDGITYVMPPSVCPDGTEPIATAITSAPSPTTSTITAPPPPPTSTVIQYIYYTRAITWYYYYYYYTYRAVFSTTELTSTRYTTSTSVTITATDDTQAEASLKSLSSSLAAATPTQSTTALSGTVPTPTSAPSAGTVSVPSTPSRTTSQISLFTGAAAQVRNVKGAVNGSLWALVMALSFLMAPGALMLLL